MADPKPETKRKRTRRNYADEMKHLLLYCKISVDVLNSVPSLTEFNTGQIAAFKAMLAQMEKDK